MDIETEVCIKIAILVIKMQFFLLPLLTNILLAVAGMKQLKFGTFQQENCTQTIIATRIYEGMSIQGTTGLTSAQRSTLKTLGSVE